MSDIDPHVQKLLQDIYVSAKRIIDRMENVTQEGFLSVGAMDLQDIVARRLTAKDTLVCLFLLCLATLPLSLRESRFPAPQLKAKQFVCQWLSE